VIATVSWVRETFVERCLACEAVVSNGEVHSKNPFLSTLYWRRPSFTHQSAANEMLTPPRFPLLTTASPARQRSTALRRRHGRWPS
jgi:hypothetical protein